MTRRFAAAWFALACFALAASPARATTYQYPLTVPASPLPMSTLATFLQNVFVSLGSCNVGSSAPANGPGSAAFVGQCWWDNATNPWVLYTTPDGGSHWVEQGTLDISTYVWTPYANGSALTPFPTPTRTGDVIYWNGSAWATLAGNNSGTQYFSENSSGSPSWQSVGSSPLTIPVGRLTLQTGVPFQTSEVEGTSVIYYDALASSIQINGAMVSIGSEISLTLNLSVQLVNDLYDLFIANVGGTPTLCTGPAWTTATAGSGARSTAGSISQTNGLYSNSNSSPMTCSYGASSTVSCAQYACTQVGVMFGAANGETTVQISPAPAAGGNGSIMGVCNTYNRQPLRTISSDYNVYTYSSTTVRFADGSTQNRVNWVQCPQPRQIVAEYLANAEGESSATAASIYLSLNNASAHTTFASGVGQYAQQLATNSTSQAAGLFTKLQVTPTEGLNFVQAWEATTSVGMEFLGDDGGDQYQQLAVNINY